MQAIMELHPRELGTTEWVDGNILGYILNVPLHTTIAYEDNATSLLVKDHISFDLDKLILRLTVNLMQIKKKYYRSILTIATYTYNVYVK